MAEQKSLAELPAQASSEETSFVRRVKRATQRKYTPEEKVRIFLEGFRGEVGISALCRREGIRQDPGEPGWHSNAPLPDCQSGSVCGEER